MDIWEHFDNIVIILLLFNQIYYCYKLRKESDNNKQLQSDYDDLITQVKELTHENYILKNQSTDTK